MIRHAKHCGSQEGRLESSERVLDGQVVWKFLNLTVEEQSQISRMIGSRRETVLKNLREMAQAMAIY